ncbi:MAG: adenine phosphoribosyltransferase [Spirochaetes bacterium]|nr:MAG: adenine phosphoribosyltransferase [Spirochaetota bacterium]
MTDKDLDKVIKKVPDFPKPGILFYDITGIITNPQAFNYCISRIEETYSDKKIDAVAAIEARGFLFAAPFAFQKSVPLIIIRKKGKLPRETLSKRFSLEYGEDEIQVHREDVKKGDRVLLIDDLIATGGTLKAASELLREGGAEVTDIFCVVGLPFLNYENLLQGIKVTTLINYHGE